MTSLQKINISVRAISRKVSYRPPTHQCDNEACGKTGIFRQDCRCSKCERGNMRKIKRKPSVQKEIATDLDAED